MQNEFGRDPVFGVRHRYEARYWLLSGIPWQVEARKAGRVPEFIQGECYRMIRF